MFGLLGKINGLSGLLGGQDGLLGNFGGAPIARGPARAPVQIEGQLPQAVANPGGVQARPGLMQRANDWMGQDIRPGMTRADALYTIGAGLKDMSPYSRGGNLDAARDMFAQREQQEQAEAQRQGRAQAYAAGMASGSFDPAAYLAELGKHDLTPSLAEIDTLQAMNEPTLINTAGGLYEKRRGHDPRLIDGSAPEPDAPNGFRWVGGQLDPIPGGPADPAYIGRVGGVRREAVVSRPMPGGARSGASNGGGGGGAVRVSSPQQLAALAPGALYIGPDGQTRRKR